MANVFIIAEIGTAHQGNIKKAEQLIKAASQTGADCAKFQIVFADEIIHPLTGDVPLPGGNVSLYSVFKKLERDVEFYRSIKDLTESYKMIFMASPFGIKSARILKKLNSEIYKVASPELNHYPLLKEIKSYNKKMILSTGISTLGDIELALKITESKNTSLLHCITAYPAPPEEYNLKLINTYRALFNVETGISDHSTDPLLVPMTSLAMGAQIIEKHFTLSNDNDGLDDPIALNPDNFRLMVDSLRQWQHESPEKILKYLYDTFNKAIIDKIIGSGLKKLAPSEEDNYFRTNRSLHATCSLEQGDILTEKNCAILRTEKVLSPGISPFFYETVVGTKIKRKIKNGEGIQWNHLL